MKKLLSSFLALLLLFSITTPTFAASSQSISIEGATTTINLTKKNKSVRQIEKVEFSEDTYEVQVGNTLSLGRIQVRIDFSDGSYEFIYEEEINFTSSNDSIFTVEDYFLRGNAIGSATLTGEYQGYTFSANINVIEQEADIVIKLPNTYDGNYVYLDSLNYFSNNRYYRMSIQSDYNPSTKEVLISGIDWSINGPYIGYLPVGNRLFKVSIDQEDKGKTIALSYNEEDYSTVTFDIPSSQNNLNYQTVSIGAFEGNHMISAGAFHDFNEYNNTFYLPKGTYGMQIIAEESNTIYNLFTDKVNFTKESETVTFSEDQLAKIDFDSKAKLNLESAGLCDPTNINSCYYMGFYNSIDNIIANKNNYEYFYFSLIDGNDREFSFQRDDFNLTEDRTIRIDNVFTTELEFNERSYDGGSKIWLTGYEGVLQVSDQYGNIIESIREDNKRNLGILTFTKGSEVYKIEVTNSLSYPSIVLPDAEGTFEVTYSFDNGDVDNRVKPNVSGDWYDWENTPPVNEQKKWTIHFNDKVNPSTIKTNNIFVVDQDGYLVENTTITISNDGEKVIVNAPSNGYESGQDYTLYINEKVKSATNKELLNRVKMVFTIQ